jgi:CubicO group peptidase (beta-lactamase class C family)
MTMALSKGNADAQTPATGAPLERRSTPEKINDGWETASPESIGMESASVNALIGLVKGGSYKNIHSVLVVKDGKLVVEEYFAGRDQADKDQDYGRDTLHTQQSVTKSVNSILVGIAIDQHLIHGVDEKASTFFPEFADNFTAPGKEALQLKHFLSMTGGFAWTESGVPYTDPRNDANVMNRNAAPLRFVLEKPLAVRPGKKFLYDSGLSVALGDIVRRASGLDTEVFAERHLFHPLGITQWFWARLPDGSLHTGGGLWLRPRDMAKIGFLYLNHGRWQGQQIVSEDWIRESTRQQAPYFGYGYQWWLRTFRGRDHAIEAYCAQGLGGQFIMVIPEMNLVSAFTSWNVGPLTEQPFDMMQRYILPATQPAH